MSSHNIKMRNKRREESEHTAIEYLQSCSSFKSSVRQIPRKKMGERKKKKAGWNVLQLWGTSSSSTRKLLLEDESISLLKAHGEEGITFDITSKFIYY